VNTTDSAVRITHKPTGIVVVHAGREEPDPEPGQGAAGAAGRLLKLEQDARRPSCRARARAQVGGGGRSEKIRTYNFKENRVTDHRIGLTLYKLDKVLAGELDDGRRRAGAGRRVLAHRCVGRCPGGGPGQPGRYRLGPPPG
jgi:peptide chain release factor 1